MTGKSLGDGMDPLLAAALGGERSETQARPLAQREPEAVILALLALARRIAEQDARLAKLVSGRQSSSTSPATPSGMIPVYEKPAAPKRRKRPGAKNGHPGARRPQPPKIDRREEHRLKRCPHCAGPVQRCRRTRTRIIEDIPEEITPGVTEHTIHRDYCPKCKKDVEPVVPDAMPGATLGHSVAALTSWFHYGLGITIAQVIEILSHHLQTQITPGGRVDAWQRLGTVLADCYEQIAKRLRKHWDFLFTFLDKPEVPFDNNLAERAIRPAVILRKNSQSNRSEQGAATPAILMSIYRTLRLRGHDPTKTITAALRTYLQTGQLPPLPSDSATGSFRDR